MVQQLVDLLQLDHRSPGPEAVLPAGHENRTFVLIERQRTHLSSSVAISLIVAGGVGKGKSSSEAKPS